MLFEGITTVEIRRERLRQAIVFKQIAEVTCAGRGDTAISFANAFERLYGEKL
jgi:hypothetical protein